MQKINEFLKNKPLFYKEIDRTRMPLAWQMIKDKIKLPKLVHIIGTNGKGSTGRFLALMLYKSGKSVGHYTSPHIFDFSERFWINSHIATQEELQTAHQRLFEILTPELQDKLSYFEYATLLAAVLFEGCEYFICEAGVGGEFDATNVFDKTLSVFTPIGFDHMALLGDTLEQIARTKLNAMCKNVLINDKMSEICIKIAKEIALKNNSNLKFASENLNSNDKEILSFYAKKQNLPSFLLSNLTLSAAAFKELGFSLKSDILHLDLRGRCEKIAPNITIDVGHNQMAAVAMAQKFKNKRVNLIFNAFEDKDIKAVLTALKPIVKLTHIMVYETPNRQLATDLVKEILSDLDMEFCDLKSIKKDEEYLVFGSFYLVEAFLKWFENAK
ncbi:MAG: Mur ligase family protein [Campylobacter sp.]